LKVRLFEPRGFRNCEALFVKIEQKSSDSLVFWSVFAAFAALQEPTGAERVNSMRQPEKTQ
jgi:hypothetical protein